MDCPNCAGDGVTTPMILSKGETYPATPTEPEYTEPDAFDCPDCGHTVIVGR